MENKYWVEKYPLFTDDHIGDLFLSYNVLALEKF